MTTQVQWCKLTIFFYGYKNRERKEKKYKCGYQTTQLDNSINKKIKKEVGFWVLDVFIPCVCARYSCSHVERGEGVAKMCWLGESCNAPHAKLSLIHI